jgi:hypothetical protein
MTRKMQDILEDAETDLKRRGVCPKCLGSGRRFDFLRLRFVTCACQFDRNPQVRSGRIRQ